MTEAEQCAALRYAARYVDLAANGPEMTDGKRRTFREVADLLRSRADWIELNRRKIQELVKNR